VSKERELEKYRMALRDGASIWSVTLKQAFDEWLARMDKGGHDEKSQRMTAAYLLALNLVSITSGFEDGEDGARAMLEQALENQREPADE
jgi:hypothetical protein